RAFQNTNSLFAGRITQFKDYGASQLATAHQQLQWLDGQIGGRAFIAADRFTIADITALVAIEFGQQVAGLKLDPALTNLGRWHQTVSSRPSAKA
ncbi:MAG TPA: glutathione binding-like protein, partial [Candidatus Binataceae bacterium]|nr:glutathione binding-like protein [Candidatus Binataceae bacterium]